MIKKLLLSLLIISLFKISAFSQALTVFGISSTGHFDNNPSSPPLGCNTPGLPVVTATFSGGGATVVGGTLQCTNPCDTTEIIINVSNVRWHKLNTNNWLHGISFPSNAGFTVAGVSLPAHWFAFPNCTGASCSAQTATGAGFYFDGTGASCCTNSLDDGNPSNNYGDPVADCNFDYQFQFRLRLCNSTITTTSLTFKIRGTADGNTGCWSQADPVASSNIQFSINTVACSPLYNYPTNAPPSQTNCGVSPPNYTATFTNTCGNSNTVTWWDAPTGGNLIGTGSPFVYDPPGSTCPVGTTLYAQCCANGTVCLTRKAFTVSGSCTPLTITNVATTNGDCTTPSSINGVTTINGTAPLSYTLTPGGTNTTGVFTGLTGTSYNLNVTDANGCTASQTVTFTPTSTASFTSTAATTPTSCPGVSDGTITMTTSPAGSYTYVLDGTTTNTTGVFNAVAGGNHSVTVTNSGPTPCTVTVNPINVGPGTAPAGPTVTSPVAYCQGATAVSLTATGTNLLWYTAATGGTGSSTAPTPSTATVGSTTYYVTQTNGPCESVRTPLTVTINTTPAAPTVTSPVTYCQNDVAVPLTATGTNLLWYTTATGGTGSSTPPTPSTAATGSTIYYVSQTTGTCEGPRASITVNVTPPPAAPGTAPVTYCQGATATPLTATGTTLLWYTAATGGTGSATAPTPSTTTVGSTTYYVSQTSGSCESPRASITVTINSTPAAPAVTSPVTYCQGAIATALTATGTNLLWYTTPTGGTGSATAPTPSTTTTGNTIYYVSQTTGTCEGPRAPITVTINSTPPAPTVTSPVDLCQGSTATPLSATGTNLLWYTTATGGTGSATAPTPSTTTTGSTIYYVSQTTGTCEGPRASITVNVNATPAAPTVTTPVVYCQNTTAVPLTATGTNLLWYTTATGGTGSATAPTPSTTTAGNTTYYVSQSAGTCEGPRASITVTVNATPAAPAVTSPVTYCQNATATPLTATGTGLLWYPTATGGTGSTTAPTPSTASGGSTSYYVSQTVSGCESPRATITVNVTPTPALPTVTSPVTYCPNETAVPLVASGSGTLNWYITPTGGTASSSAPTPSTATAGTTNYYVSQTISGCEGPRETITVNVTSTPPVPGVTSPIAYCQGVTATPLTATGTNLLWYTAATGGTGSTTAPTPNTATTGSTTYYVSQTPGSCESPRASITVTVNTTLAAPTTNPVSYCQNAAATPLTAGGSGLLWYTTPTGGTGSSTAPAPSTTTAGLTSYYVSQTSGTCEGPRAQLDVTIIATPVAPTVTSPVDYCQNATATPLTATGTNLLWYTTATGGTGSSTAPTPSTAAAGSVNYYVSQSTTTGSCEGPRAMIAVNVTAAPAAPTVTSPLTYCQNATAPALTATGTNLLWYTTATGGTGSSTAPTPSTAAAGSTIYYVSQTTGTCEGSRAAITVNINPTPTATVTSTATSCPAVNDGTVTVNTPSAGTAPFSYTINATPSNTTGASSGIFTGLSAGNYTITITDANSCVGTVPVTVASNPALTATAAATNTSCNNANDGTVTVTPANSGSYTINTTPTQTNTTGNFTSLAPGTYTVTYTASTGCAATTSPVTVAAGAALPVAASTTATSCPGVNNGTITIAQAGGGGSYSYAINAIPANTTGVVNGVFTGLSAGTYTVTVTENTNTCTGTSNVTVAQGAALTSTQSFTNPACSGTSTGTFTASPTAGQAPYSYTINAVPANTTGASTGTFTGLPAGNYTITFTDANGCTGTQSHTLTTNPPVAATETHVNPACFGSSTGSVTITASGGSGTYTYALLPSGAFQAGNTFSNLASGSYTIRVKDNLGCTFDIPATLTQPSQLTSSAVKNNDATCEGNDGGITVTANGGTAPYSYSIDNGVTYQASGTFTNAVNTTYNGTIKVKDANNCVATANPVTVGQINNLTLDILAAPDTTICQDQKVKFTPTTNAGATANYLWTSLTPAVPNSTIDSIRILNATVSPVDTVIYKLTVTYKACTISDNVKVNVIWKPKVDAGPNVSICRLDSTLLTGSISHISGSVDSLAWTPLDSLTTPNNSLSTWAHPTRSTWYRLTAYTKLATYGCDFAVYDSVKVVVPADVIASAGHDTIAVLGQPHQLMGSGGVGYSWWSPSGAVIQNPFTQNPTVILNSDANFFVEVQNSIGCKDTAHVFVTVYDGPTYYVPNAFSPNGDGMNDVFRAIPVGIANTEYFKVFNRFGQTVFESNQYLKGWDGTFKGQKQPIGAYTWMIKGVDKYNKTVEMQGTVLIVQ